MATLTELFNLWNDSAIQNRITQAGMNIAQEILAEAVIVVNHTNRAKWAVAVMSNPQHWGTILMRVLLAKHNALTVAQITGATDATLTTAIRDVVNVFADNLTA